MMPKLVKPGAMDERTLKNTESARFFWQTLRGIVVIVALWGFIAFLTVDLYGGELGMTAFTIFALAMVAMRVMFVERGTLGTVVSERTLNAEKQTDCRNGLFSPMVSFSVWASTGNAPILVFLSTIPTRSRPVVGTTVCDYGCLWMRHRNCCGSPDTRNWGYRSSGLRVHSPAGSLGWFCIEAWFPSLMGFCVLTLLTNFPFTARRIAMRGSSKMKKAVSRYSRSYSHALDASSMKSLLFFARSSFVGGTSGDS